jgi:hypothetical protein
MMSSFSSIFSPSPSVDEGSTQTQKQNDHSDMLSVEHNYTDHATARAENPLYDPPLKFLSVDRQPAKGGVTVPFPLKLHEMLDQIEADGLADVISWQPHGRCFVVHEPKSFSDSVMPTYFRQTKFASFQRQLNLYGFSRLTSGRDKGGYYHELFLKGKRFLCHRIVRLKIKGTGVRKASSPETEPQFYNMPPLDVSDHINEASNEQRLVSSTLWLNSSNSNATPLSHLFRPGQSFQQQMAQAEAQTAVASSSFSQQQPNIQQYTQVYTLPQMMQAQQQLPQVPNMMDWTKVLQQQQAQIAAMQQQLAMHNAQQKPLIVQVQHVQVPMQQQQQQQQHYVLSPQTQRQVKEPSKDPEQEFDAILAALCKMPVESSNPHNLSSSLLQDSSLGHLFEMLTE